MSMIRAAGAGGGGAEDHELLRNRYGIGPDGVAWHLDTETYNRVVNMQYYRGFFLNEEALKAAYPTDVQGAYAIVLSTGTFWFWEGAERGWVDTGEAVTEVVGIPPGGVKGQVLTKRSDADNDVGWSDGGSGSGVHNDLAGLQGGLSTERYHVTEAGEEKVNQWVATAPDKPVNVAPYHDEVEIEERPIFESSPYYHPYGYEMYAYQIEIYDASDNLVYNPGPWYTTFVSFVLDAGVLLANSTYTWRVRYQGSNMVWSSWSELTLFATQSAFAPVTILQPRIILPGDRTIVNSNTPTILTTPFDEGSGLTQGDGTFQISNSSDFTAPIESGLGKDSYKVQTRLTRGSAYFARAQHADDSTPQIKSRWSPIVSFAIREYYRKTRIGLVLYDENNWLLQRVDDNFMPIDLDGEYWSYHPIYASLIASRSQYIEVPGVSPDGSPYAMSTIPAIFIRSGAVPSGPYAGKRFWMIDTNEPSASDVTAGWHLHGAFRSNDFGSQDSILISRYLSIKALGTIVLQDYVYIDAGGYIPNEGDMNAWMSVINTDASDPLRRGWTLGTYIHNELLKLLIMFETPSFMEAQEKYQKTTNSFFGLYRAARAAAYYYAVNPGINWTSAIAPGSLYSGDRFQFEARIPETGSSSNVRANYLARGSDAPSNLLFDDYMLPGYKKPSDEDHPIPGIVYLSRFGTYNDTFIPPTVKPDRNPPESYHGLFSEMSNATGSAGGARMSKVIKFN